MNDLASILAALEPALRDIGEHARADWVAERRRRASGDPEGVRADLRGVLGGMGSIDDLALDAPLVRRVRAAAGDARGSDRPRRIIPARPGRPIRP